MKKTVCMMFLLAGMALPSLAVAETNVSDRKIADLASAQLQKKDTFKSVTVAVDDGIVTLNGEVPLYIDKMNAEKRVRKVKTVDGVRNHIQVGGAEIADSEVRENLASKLRYDRIGYGIVFNNLGVDVRNGVVTLTGNVRDYPDHDSALAIVATTAGVKEVVDEIGVAPASIVDDALRVKLARAIYGNSSLQKYALDPQAPIRIVVEGGHVELAGMVLSDMDRQIAYTQASAVPGVFSVTNHIAVQGQTVE
jgi:hyperosmotically inducible protein